MGAVSVLWRGKQGPEAASVPQSKKVDWVNVTAASALVVGGLLLLSEKRRAGLAVTAAGSALALLGEEETIRAWWKQFPQLVDQVQNVVGQVQDKMGEFASRRDALHQALNNVADQVDILRDED